MSNWLTNKPGPTSAQARVSTLEYNVDIDQGITSIWRDVLVYMYSGNLPPLETLVVIFDMNEG